VPGCTAGLDLHKAYGPRFARIIFHSADELASFGAGVTKVKEFSRASVVDPRGQGADHDTANHTANAGKPAESRCRPQAANSAEQPIRRP